jgi:acyl carrier protein
MKLVNYIEEDFGIQVENDDLEITNFSSVNRITEFIESKQ